MPWPEPDGDLQQGGMESAPISNPWAPKMPGPLFQSASAPTEPVSVELVNVAPSKVGKLRPITAMMFWRLPTPPLLVLFSVNVSVPVVLVSQVNDRSPEQ